MSSATEPIPSPGTIDKRWAWGVRIALLVSISLPWLMSVESEANPCGPGLRDLWLVTGKLWIFFDFFIIYLITFSRRPSRVGLTWAAKKGLFFSCLPFLIAIQKLRSGEITEGFLWR